MRSPSKAPDTIRPVHVDLTDELDPAWRPSRISDRKLMELADRLKRVQRLGGAFARIGWSDQAKQRVEELATRK